jgi:hypothetical protein
MDAKTQDLIEDLHTRLGAASAYFLTDREHARKMLEQSLGTVRELEKEAKKLTPPSESHAVELLRRWADWARAHGHDHGIWDDTRSFLPNVKMREPGL